MRTPKHASFVGLKHMSLKLSRNLHCTPPDNWASMRSFGVATSGVAKQHTFKLNRAKQILVARQFSNPRRHLQDIVFETANGQRDNYMTSLKHVAEFVSGSHGIHTLSSLYYSSDPDCHRHDLDSSAPTALWTTLHLVVPSIHATH